MEEIKKLPKAQRHSEFPKYWVFVQAQTKMAIKKGYTKLVPSFKAFEMINGKAQVLNGEFIRVKVLKHEYKEI